MTRQSNTSGTPFQDWCEDVLRGRRWTLRELARRLGVSASTCHHYRTGRALPTVATQRRLAALTGTPVEDVARLVWASKAGGGRGVTPTLPPPRRAVATARSTAGKRWRGWRGQPLGLQFTMYATSGIEAEALARLYTLAGARRMNLEAALNEALKIALPIMERRAR
jgi:transcriptional regulator with XRE-family HTH domain